MNVCGFPINNRLGEAIAHCNDEAGHEGECNWLLSREDPPCAPETLAEGILRRVGEMDATCKRAHALLHDAERTIERLRGALTVVATESNDELSRDIARKALEP